MTMVLTEDDHQQLALIPYERATERHEQEMLHGHESRRIEALFRLAALGRLDPILARLDSNHEGLVTLRVQILARLDVNADRSNNLQHRLKR
ncbi:hypothetical protein H0H93_015601 [Arthromyces matolae]|nr:hypothetical protein H0H93_015601 [Arthromyces matolae]